MSCGTLTEVVFRYGSSGPAEIFGAEYALAFLQMGAEGLDVGLEDVVDDDGGDGDDLGGPGGHDGHQDQEQHRVLSGGAEQLLGDQRGGQTWN